MIALIFKCTNLQSSILLCRRDGRKPLCPPAYPSWRYFCLKFIFSHFLPPFFKINSQPQFVLKLLLISTAKLGSSSYNMCSYKKKKECNFSAYAYEPSFHFFYLFFIYLFFYFLNSKNPHRNNTLKKKKKKENKVMLGRGHSFIDSRTRQQPAVISWARSCL